MWWVWLPRERGNTPRGQHHPHALTQGWSRSATGHTANAGTANAGTANAGTANAGTANAGTANAGTANAGSAETAGPGERGKVPRWRALRTCGLWQDSEG
ncbi:pentapeptide repeat-containing protein [Phytomonospora endophytica]|uniref:pentapeptide repeat-containing protein n=1 Tax=Phytomonospora endophytica TaxID=714109 RepID=UPI00160EC342